MAKSAGPSLSPAGPQEFEAPVLPMVRPADSVAQTVNLEPASSSHEQHTPVAATASAVASKVNKVRPWLCSAASR